MKNYDEVILGLLVVLAEQTGEHLSEPRLRLFASELLSAGHNAEDVANALRRLFRRVKRFPSIAEIEEEMGVATASVADEGRMIAATIYTAVQRYGSLPPDNRDTSEAIRLAVGPAVWELISKLGGWNSIVEQAGAHDPGTFSAQVRELATAYLKSGVIEIGKVPDHLPSGFDALAMAKRAREAALPTAEVKTVLPPAERAKLQTTLEGLKLERAKLLAAKHAQEGTAETGGA